MSDQSVQSQPATVVVFGGNSDLFQRKGLGGASQLFHGRPGV